MVMEINNEEKPDVGELTKENGQLITLPSYDANETELYVKILCDIPLYVTFFFCFTGMSSHVKSI